MDTLDYADLPARWTSYLINGDDSSLTSDDLDLVEAEVDGLAELGIMIVGVSEDTFFGRYNGLGDDLATYTLMDRG